MLTRLRVKGFKNLHDVDVAFGPLTCIAGANGVGKSNLFDALLFLAALADKPLMEAAGAVRDSAGRSTDVRSLFLQYGPGQHVERMSFEAEMLIPPTGVDDLGQPAEATTTFLRYGLELRLQAQDEAASHQRLEVVREELNHVTLSEAARRLSFPHARRWRESVAQGQRRSPYISTANGVSPGTVKMHADGGSGRTRPYAAAQLPRTVLSSANAAESPTALLVRREMQSWRLLQLEPTAMRAPDSFTAPAVIAANGAHLPATVRRLCQSPHGRGTESPAAHRAAVLARLGNRLHPVIANVRGLDLEEDAARQLIRLRLTDRARAVHDASALSDGALRFLALAVLAEDPQAGGLLCFEEPENGIHPHRIPDLLRVLGDLAVRPDEAADADNPLRQVILNTHSPLVVQSVNADDLLLAERCSTKLAGDWIDHVRFRWLAGSWRARRDPQIHPAAPGDILSYLQPERSDEKEGGSLAARRPAGGFPGQAQPVRDYARDLELRLFPVGDEPCPTCE